MSFTLGFGSRSNGLLDRLGACLQRRRAGGYHSGYQWLIAMPQYPIAQPGSASVTAVNPFRASGYQNEWQGPHGLFATSFSDGRPQTDLEVHFTRRLCRRGTSIRACSRPDRLRGSSGGEEKYRAIRWRVIAISSRMAR